MPKFNVYTKQRVIQRNKYTVEATTAEEAKAKVIDAGTEAGELLETDYTDDEIVQQIEEIK